MSQFDRIVFSGIKDSNDVGLVSVCIKKSISEVQVSPKMPCVGTADSDGETKPIIQAAREMRSVPPKPIIVPARNGIPARWELAVLSMLGFMFLYALRFNISQAIVAMTGNVTAHCRNTSIIVPAEFDWSNQEIGLVQSAFFYGYAAMSIPGGWLAGRFGSKRVMAGSLFLNAALCLVTPEVATAGVYYLTGLRAVQGMAQAPFYPAMHRMWGRWAPQSEVGMLASISYSGPYVGNIIVYFAGGLLSEHGFGAHVGQDYCGSNWPSVFYVFGFGALGWVVIWLCMVHDTPAQHNRISHGERTYIEKNLAKTSGDSDNRLQDEPYTILDVFPFASLLPESMSSRCRVPWNDILTSVPVWALILNLLAFDYGMYTLMTGVPTYLNKVEKLDVTSSGIFSALPFAMMWLVTIFAGAFTRLPVVQAHICITWQRKILTLVGCFIPATFLVLAAYNRGSTTAIIYITVAAGVSGCQMVGSGINQIDLSPRYADVLMGWTNLWAGAGGIAAPYVLSVLTPHQTHAEWKLVFFVTSGLFVFGGVIYVLFGTAKQQVWGEKKPSAPEPQQNNVQEEKVHHQTERNSYASDRPLLV